MLTPSEFAACIVMLKSLPVQSLASGDWSRLEQRAYGALIRAGYVALREPPAPTKLTAPFRWSEIVATESGRTYLRQIEHGWLPGERVLPDPIM